MRGKKPKEREKYVLRMADGTLVEVTRPVYLEWYQSRRRERYQKERDQKHRLCSLDALKESGTLFGTGTGLSEGTEEIALRNIQRNTLRKLLEKLPEQDARLIILLYYEENTVKAVAELYGCSRKSVQKQRKRILKELAKMMQETQTEQGGN